MAAADTPAGAAVNVARIQRAVLSSKTGAERTSMALEMSELVRQIAIDGIRRRSPDIGSAELVLKLIERLHGREIADAVSASGAVAGGH